MTKTTAPRPATRKPARPCVFRSIDLPTPLRYTILLESIPGTPACERTLVEMEAALAKVRKLHEEAAEGTEARGHEGTEGKA